MKGDFDHNRVQRHDYLLKYTIVPLIPRFIKPNHFTMLRLLLIPVVLWFLLEDNYSVGVPLFFVTAFTDMIDGSLARLRNQVTEWGKIYDPVADKLLISTVLILIVAQHINPFLALLIVGLDVMLIVGGVIRKRQGYEVGANTWGKIKMCLQVGGVLALLIALWLGVDLFIPFSVGLFYIAIAFAVISLYTYGI